MTNTPGDTAITHGDEQLPHLTKGGGGRSEMKAFAVGMATSGWTTCAARGGEARSGWGLMFDALNGASRNERGEGEVKETGLIRLFGFAIVMVALLLAARELQSVSPHQVDEL